MRPWVGLIALALAGACASAQAQPPFEPTAEFFINEFRPTFITPRPDVVPTQGINLPLRAGDQLIADCAGFFAYEIGEMTSKEQAAFNKSVACIYPPAGQLGPSGAYYSKLLSDLKFEDDSGTYVQSGMRIACNRTHTVSMALKGKIIPPFITNEKGETIEIKSGGELVHETLMLAISDTPCDRYKREAELAEIRAESPAPDGYASFPQPVFVEPSPERISWGAFEISLRPGDRLVSHCAQYYADEIGGTLSDNPTPLEFADRNRLTRCIHVPQDGIVAASAYYADQLRLKGLTGSAVWAAPNPDEQYPPLKAGQYDWSARTYFCDDKKSIGLSALARYGQGVLLDPLTGEFWSTLDITGGRRVRLEGANYPHKILVLNLNDLPCEW